MRNYVLVALLLLMSFLSVACGGTTQAEETQTIDLDQTLIDARVTFFEYKSGSSGTPQNKLVVPDKNSVKICKLCRLKVNVGGNGSTIGTCDSPVSYEFLVWKSKNNTYSLPDFGRDVFFDPNIHHKLETSVWHCQQIDDQVEYTTPSGTETQAYRIHLSLNKDAITKGYSTPDKLDDLQVQASTNFSSVLKEYFTKSLTDQVSQEYIRNKKIPDLTRGLTELATTENEFFKPKAANNGTNYNPTDFFKIDIQRKWVETRKIDR